MFACVSHIAEESHDLIFPGSHLDGTSLGSKGKPAQVKIAIPVNEIFLFHLNLVFRARKYVGVLWWSLRGNNYHYFLVLFACDFIMIYVYNIFLNNDKIKIIQIN